jgi:hypothetical protein
MFLELDISVYSQVLAGHRTPPCEWVNERRERATSITRAEQNGLEVQNRAAKNRARGPASPRRTREVGVACRLGNPTGPSFPAPVESPLLDKLGQKGYNEII